MAESREKSRKRDRKEKDKEIDQIQMRCKELRKQRRAIEARNKEIKLNNMKQQKAYLMMANIQTSTSAQNSIKIKETNQKSMKSPNGVQ